MGDFNVHHREWLSSNLTDPAGLAAFELATLNGLQQLIVGPTRIPDSGIQHPGSSPLDLFLSTHPLYTTFTHPPLGKSDHNLIAVSCPMSLKSPYKPSNRRLWHFASARWQHLRDFYVFLPWKDYAFRSVDLSACEERIVGVIMCDMEAYVLFSFPTSSSNCQPWFDDACSESILIRNRAHQPWKSNMTPFSHSNF